jgi:hypothetical protein
VLASLVQNGVLVPEIAVAGLLKGGLRMWADEKVLGVLLGPLGRLATIGTEVDAVGELELLIHRVYAECRVLASLRGPVLEIADRLAKERGTM